MRKTSQFYTAVKSRLATSQGNTQNLGRSNGILAENLIEITHSKKQHSIGMFLFHFLILLHQRRIREARLLFDLWGFLWLRRDWVRRRRRDTVGIIQFQIKTQVQRFVKCLAQILGNAVDTTVMMVHDSGFAILVSTHLCVSADYILRKSLKEFVARHFRTTVNNRLDKELFISRQRLLSGVLLQDDKV